MRKDDAKSLARHFRAFGLNETRVNGLVKGYGSFVDGRPALSFFYAKSASLWLCLIDWRDNGDYYLVVYVDQIKGLPVIELHESADVGDSSGLRWSYDPRKQDGKNPDRKKAFAARRGSCQVFVKVPTASYSVRHFVRELTALVSDRLAAHALEEEEGVVPKTPNTGFPEGRRYEQLHLKRERNPALIREAKRLALEREGRLVCKCCGFDFEREYGDIGANFIEAHHTKPVSELNGDGDETLVRDIALVCANCHRMLHRRRPWLTMRHLGKLLSTSTRR